MSAIVNGKRISIHALREESDFKIKAKYDRATGISIHALREESDPISNGKQCFPKSFQSTLSVRRATVGDWASRSQENISIHALREESDCGGNPRLVTRG